MAFGLAGNDQAINQFELLNKPGIMPSERLTLRAFQHFRPDD